MEGITPTMSENDLITLFELIKFFSGTVTTEIISYHPERVILSD